jgi:predicted RNase H-like HicB family nuclease
MRLDFTAVFEKVPEGYIGYLAELPGANTQAASLEEARVALAEAAEMVLEANRSQTAEKTGDRDVIREPLTVEL